MKVKRWLAITCVEDSSNIRVCDRDNNTEFLDTTRDYEKDILHVYVQDNGVVCIYTK